MEDCDIDYNRWFTYLVLEITHVNVDVTLDMFWESKEVGILWEGYQILTNQLEQKKDCILSPDWEPSPIIPNFRKIFNLIFCLYVYKHSV